MRLTLLTKVAAFGALFGALPCRAETMQLGEALRYALDHAPGMAQAKETLRIRSWEVDQARAKFLPSLDFTSNQGYLKTYPDQTASVQATPSAAGPVIMSTTTQSPWFGQLGLSLTETIYDNGQSLTQRDLSEVNADSAKLTAMMTRDDTILAVTRAYYSLSQAEILLATNRQQTQLMDKELAQLDAFYHQGLKTKKDYLRLKSQAQRAALEVMNAEATRASALLDLQKAIGAPPEVMFTTLNADEILRKEPTFPTATPNVETSYIARIAQKEDAAAGLNVDLAKRKNLPVLQVSSGLGYQVPDYAGAQVKPFTQDYWSWNVTVGLTYNLWDFGSRRHDIDIAEGQRMIHSADTSDKVQALRADIAKLMDNLRFLQAGFRLNRELIQLETENFANLQEDYRQGKVAYLDLVTGLNDLLSAKVNFYTAYINILTALAQYRYYEGTIYDSVAGV